MASGTKNRGGSKSAKSAKSAKALRSAAAVKKPKPWGTVAIILGLVVLAVVVIGYSVMRVSEVTAWRPSDSNQDPSDDIAGVVKVKYEQGQHVNATQRVAYDHSPPFGGPHDNIWADCNGMVYATPVRSENMVHMLEHGAVWIAYNPDLVKGADLDVLRSKVSGQDFIAMSPYPGLDKPFSLQSWGHQLKLDNVNDERVDQFIQALKRNNWQFPEPGARCDTQAGFDPSNPPPLDTSPLPADAVKMDGTGSSQAPMSNGQEVPAPTSGSGAPTSGAPTSGSQPPSQ
ncbi:DUF3105 domain-containing protein [Kibdelosporangium philippinense]|uniref:DUF3105 domain-containing protein n=1 Tax=Kibdelosporangium philippinense TaxID=211113 RepID=A0ABS8ZJY8_9PSEU|nr:DUF3105 domain-containing protein [Kibdelosporangium philippinense]MCE7008091.1 DUF3105 domain-containing protein [Kibdelosporangium philippinense]